jgi:hypothetical protein
MSGFQVRRVLDYSIRVVIMADDFPRNPLGRYGQLCLHVYVANQHLISTSQLARTQPLTVQQNF